MSSAISIKQVKRNTVADLEYGSFQTVTNTYEAKVPYLACNSSVETAMRLISDRMENVPRASITLREDLPKSSMFLFEVVTERQNFALREDNLIWSSRLRGNLTSEQSSVIYTLPLTSDVQQLCTVEHDGDVQVPTFTKYSPVAELSCVGIFRTPPGTTNGVLFINPPMPSNPDACIPCQITASSLCDAFLGKINSASFRGFGQYVAMCSSVEIEPFDVNSSNPTRYKIQFRFQIKPDGWGPWVFYRDPDTGFPPPTSIYGVGWGRLEPPLLGSPYRYVDFNEIWPFTVTEGTS